MTGNETYPKPLLAARLARLPVLKVKARPPATLNLTMGTFALPERARTRLAKARGGRNVYRLDAVISGAHFGRRTLREAVPLEQGTRCFENARPGLSRLFVSQR